MTIRAVKGTDANQAAAAMEKNLREELKSILLNRLEDLPEITMGEVCEIDEETAQRISCAGCTWYPDDYPPQTRKYIQPI